MATGHPQQIARNDAIDFQRKRDDNKNKICAFQGGWAEGPERKIVQNAIFHGKRHDNKILKVNILLSRNFVVMAQAPRFVFVWQMLRDAEMTIKIFFGRSSQKGGRQRVRKEGQQGTHVEILLSA